ncbi:MAG: DUF3500 domain-containing protein [Blastocatellales bacterium]
MKRFATLSAVVCFGLLAMSVAHLTGRTQSRPFSRPLPEQDVKRLNEPFVGVTTDGKAIPGLFAIKSTGVSTRPVRIAAEKFIAGLNDEQKKRTLYPVDDQEWRRWDNRHFAPRQGVGFEEMSESQRELAFALFRSGLSAKGLKKTQDIMKLNGTLAELTNNTTEYGEWRYWVTIMGTPSDTEPWGWQLDGHHVIINYFILGDQVVMTPVFMGSEPIRAESGKFKGTVVMQDEQDKAISFFQTLTQQEQASATIKSEKGPSQNLSEAYKDNLVLDYAGLQVKTLDARQKKALLTLIGEYVDNMKEGHAKVKMEEVRKHIDQTWFAWIGKADPNGVFYYRIQSPVILIEFDHQRPIALARSDVPTRNHIHTVIRTPNGNDYGKDLLRQHHQRSRHD